MVLEYLLSMAEAALTRTGGLIPRIYAATTIKQLKIALSEYRVY